MRRAALLSHQNILLVYPERLADAGFWLSVEPFVVLSGESNTTDLGIALMNVLKLSSGTETTPTDWKKFNKPRLLAAGVKSESALQRRAKLVAIEMTDFEITFRPNRNGGGRGDSKGFAVLSGQESVLSASAGPAEVGAAALAALSRCVDEP